MNRHYLGALAVALTALTTQATFAQQGYPTGVGYPMQTAGYAPTAFPPAGVQSAVYSGPAQGGVQLATCAGCSPGGAVYGGMVDGGASYGDVGQPPMDLGAAGGCGPAGCDGGCAGGCAGGGAGGCAGGCGILGGGLSGALHSLHYGHEVGYDGYNQHFGKAHGPFGDGGCCLPRWFDAHAEWMYLQRDYSESLAFSSDGILGPEVLNASQLDLAYRSGYRLTGAYLVGPASALEATYFGGFNWASGAQAQGNGTLYSVFSQFGSNPLNGFPETDAAFLHQINLSSELDNAELNFRHRFVSANCLVHTSLLVGARYLRLRDDFIYSTDTGTNAMDYLQKTDNDLVGAQIGGDMFFCITPRFRVGGEVEAGVYGNTAKQRTRMISTASPELRESVRETDAAFVAEAGLIGLYRVTSRLTVRGGYQLLFIDEVATAIDNFNTVSPFSARTTFLDNSGDVFFHGSTLGFEWTW